MMLASALTAFCDTLRTQTGAQVILGRPNDRARGIYVWPWRLEENVSPRVAPPRTNPDGSGTLEASAMNIHFLVLVRPPLTSDGLSKLDAVRQAILDHPILDVAEKRAQIIFSPLAHHDLAALFTAASLPLTICLSATLREIS